MAYDILVKVGADITDFSKKMKESQKSIEDFKKSNKETFESFKKVGTAVTAAGATIAVGLGVAAKHAIDFESSFAGVRKTVSASEAEFAELEKGIRDMSKELPASVHEINGVAEAAGQLGIEKESILEFTRTMIDLGEATNLTSEEAATSFARFANIVGMSQSDFDRLGSSVVELGNNLATTEAEIVAMSMRLAGVGNQVGMTEAEIMALAGAMSSVGIEAEAGGTAMSTVLKKMQNAVSDGGKDLENFAKAAGMSSKEFATAFEKDPVKALDSFIKNLAKSSEEGENLNAILDSVGIKGIREADTILRLAGASDILSEAVDMSTKAWDENTALSDEARQRYETLASKLAILKNTLIDIGISIGQALMPAISVLVEFLQKLAEGFSNLSQPVQSFIAISAAVVAALALIIGPILLLIGFIPQIVVGFGALSTVVTGLGAAFTLLTGPIGLTIAAIVAIIAALVLAYNKVEWFREMVDAAWQWIKEATMIAFEYVKGIIQSVLEDVREVISSATERFKEIWDKHGESIMTVVKTVMGIVQDVIKARMEFIKGIFQAIWPIISGIVKIAWNFIKTYVEIGASLVMGTIDTIMSLIKGDWEGAWNAIKRTAEDIWNKIEGFFESVDLVQIGKDIIQGLIDGIGSMGGAAWSMAQSIGARIKDGFTSFFSIRSPSRLMMSLAKHIPGGAIKGMESMMGKVKAATRKMSEAMTPDTQTISMDYATPRGTYASLASAVSGTVDVDSRDDMLAGAIDDLRKEMTNLRVEVNEREFGRLVSDTTTDQRNQTVRGRGHRRI